MSDPSKVAAARIAVERARGALADTANELLERFQPHNLVDDLWEQAKIKGADLAEDAVDAVAKRPVAIGGVVAALAMFLAREPLKKATVKFYDVMTPLLEPRSKPSALKPKAAAKPVSSKVEKTGRPPAKRQARTPRRPAQKKTEK
jgi:hypothetical protein